MAYNCKPKSGRIKKTSDRLRTRKSRNRVILAVVHSKGNGERVVARGRCEYCGCVMSHPDEHVC